MAWSKLTPKNLPPDPNDVLNQKVPDELKRLSKTSETVLAAPDSFWLYSLNPKDLNGVVTDKPLFHGYEILGRLEVTNKVQQAMLVSALKKGMEEAKGIHAACFDPGMASQPLKAPPKSSY